MLGDLLIRDDGRIGWTGRTGEFDEEELDELADRMAIRIDPSSENIYSAMPIRNNGDFLVYSDEPSETDRSSVPGIRAGDEQIILPYPLFPVAGRSDSAAAQARH